MCQTYWYPLPAHELWQCALCTLHAALILKPVEHASKLPRASCGKEETQVVICAGHAVLGSLR